MQSPTQKTTYAARENNPVEVALKDEWVAGHEMLNRLAASEEMAEHVPELKDAIFCGHLVADLDSIAGALGAAELYGGIPARASDINSETEFALERWGIKLDSIKLVDDLLAEQGDAARVCLVDFQQTTQLNKAIKESQIVGIIDHHALQSSTIVTQRPIFVDIRPWGSMSSIIAHSFVMLKKPLPKPIAGMLLCAILSDTLNLRSPTTTAWDRKIVSMLVQYTEVPDANLLCAQQFKAKSRALATMDAHALCVGDLKQFKLGKEPSLVRVAFAVVETTDPSSMLARVAELVPEVVAVRTELAKTSGHAVDACFLAIVDIVELRTHLIVCGQRERSLATAASFDASPLAPEVKELAGEAGKYLFVMAPGQVSRKADFIPPLSTAVEAGWSPAALTASSSETSLESLAAGTEVAVQYSDACPAGKLVRSKSGGLDGVMPAPLTPATADVLQADAAVGAKRPREA